MSPEYVLNALAWSFGGFAVGYFVCATNRDLHSIKEAIVPEQHEPQRQPVRPYIPNRLLGVILVVMAVVTTVAIALATQQRSEVSECQAEVNRDLITALSERSKIADEDRHALDALILAVVANSDLSEKERQRQGREAINNYVKTIAESKAARARVDMPKPTDYECGG